MTIGPIEWQRISSRKSQQPGTIRGVSVHGSMEISVYCPRLFKKGRRRKELSIEDYGNYKP
jgi:hypothetical protein